MTPYLKMIKTAGTSGLLIYRNCQASQLTAASSRRISVISWPASYTIYGYGAVTYLRLTDSYGNISCTLLTSKSRVVPLKQITIPRLELSAASIAIRLDKKMKRELELPIDDSVFWTDSTSVLKYIKNEDKTFHTFVANRVALIRDQAHVSGGISNPNRIPLMTHQED